MKVCDLKKYFVKISEDVTTNKDYLVKLDQAFGDGDLGVSMDSGFKSILKSLDCEEKDFGKMFLLISKNFNESAPSSLGTIISFFFMGIAKSLKGYEEVDLVMLKKALVNGLITIEQKANSKLGEKTILDALNPAVHAFEKASSFKEALSVAADAAKQGMENTKDIIAVHGRAAYHKEKTLGHIDGGAYLAYVVFTALNKA